MLQARLWQAHKTTLCELFWHQLLLQTSGRALEYLEGLRVIAEIF